MRTVAICIVDQDGAIPLELSVRSELPDIVKALSAIVFFAQHSAVARHSRFGLDSEIHFSQSSIRAQ